MNAEALAEIKLLLSDTGLVDLDNADYTSLAGGVSCDVVLVQDKSNQVAFVLKRALTKLRVKEDWYADPARNSAEHRYMSVVGELLPGVVPRVIYADDSKGFFCMEWLGDGWANWKTLLLNGAAEPKVAAQSGHVLGGIHRETWANVEIQKQFETTENFFALRLDPYLLATAKKHPALAAFFIEETERIRSSRECLVHGDFSPKNLLVREDRLVVLDCEVAWFGDCAFDVAFLMNHLHLKGLYHAPAVKEFPSLPSAALSAYAAARGLTSEELTRLEIRICRLLLQLMLARVDGKSPVEYLEGQPKKQDFIRRFVHEHLPNPPTSIAELTRLWYASIACL